MNQNAIPPVARGHSRSRWLAVGGLLGALATSSCCVVPLIFFSLGASGTWIGQLSGLNPYQPAFATFTLTMLIGGHYAVWFNQPRRCRPNSLCARGGPGLMVKVTLIIASILTVVALIFPYIAPYLLEA